MSGVRLIIFPTPSRRAVPSVAQVSSLNAGRSRRVPRNRKGQSRRAWCLLRGTEGSNPAPSSGESANFRFRRRFHARTVKDRVSNDGGNVQGNVMRGRDPSNGRRNRADVARARRGEGAGAFRADYRHCPRVEGNCARRRAAGPRSSRPRLRLVHRRLRHRRLP